MTSTKRLEVSFTPMVSAHSVLCHYSDVIMGAMASQTPSLVIVYSTVYSGADQRKHQSSASLAFVRGIHRLPVIAPHKWPVTRKMFPFDDVIVHQTIQWCNYRSLWLDRLFLPDGAWIRNYIHVFVVCIDSSLSESNNGWAKSPLQLEHGRGITFHGFI